MKCGGISQSIKIADIASYHDKSLMWGCNDESAISIAAGLHIALASRSTKYLDLDGSLDLAEDIVTGGFTIKNGVMRPLDLPGLGVKLKQ